MKINKLLSLKIILLIAFFIFIGFPIIYMLFQIDGKDLYTVFIKDNFFGLLKNSLIYTLSTTILVLTLSFLSAYLLNESRLKHKTIYVLLFTVPMLIPSISSGLGIINIFGNNGFLDKLFGLKIEAYGYLGLILGSFMYSFPVAFLMFYDTLRYQDKKVYEAAYTLGITRRQAFLNLLLPSLKTVIGSVVFTVFTMVFTDYGVPLAVGGRVQVLPTYLYNEVINRLNFSKGIIVSVSLLFPAFIAFLYDFLIKKDKNTIVSESSIEVKKSFNIFTFAVCALIIIVLFLPVLSFAILGFVKSFPNDMTLTFEHLVFVIKDDLFAYLGNSLIIAILTAIVGTIFAFMAAYLNARAKGKTSKILHFIIISSLSIPGIVLGLSYVLFFKSTFLYGTIAILVVVNIAHFISSPYLMAKSSLEKIDLNYEIVGQTLGISRFSIFKSVIIPNSFLTMIEMFSYFFTNAMVTISAVSFLANIFNLPLALIIPGYEAQVNYEAAAIVSLTILIVNVIFKLLITLLSKKLRKRGLSYAN